VRDTLPEEISGLLGRGIHGQCYASGACGSLRVSSSLVSGNREGGIVMSGVDLEITTTVVRDTLPGDNDMSAGMGIEAHCDAEFGACGTLRVSSSLVSGNQTAGIQVGGVDAEITATVVRDNIPLQGDESFGRGIGAWCGAEGGSCGSLRVSSCLVSGNQEIGIAATGVDLEVTNTVVRDTLPQEVSGLFGRGIGAQCDPEFGACGTLRVSSSVVSGSREIGVFSYGVDTEITATVVRDTLPQEVSGEFGRGVSAQCYPEAGACGSLRISSSLVTNSENVGIFVSGVPTTLERVAVIDTRPNARGDWQGIYGQGIWALCGTVPGECGDLSMISCLVESSHSSGVAVEGVSGFITSSVVLSVTSQSLDSKYGFGVQIGGLEGEEMPTFNVIDCEVHDAELAGILYYRARGTLSGSVVSGGENSVIMNEGSEPTILDNNILLGTVESDPIWANIYPSPAPAPSLPLEPTE
jgi:hypothetical protein